jgi:hypothetical protein
MKDHCNGKDNKEVVKILSNLELDRVFDAAEHHGKTDEKRRDDDDEPRNAGEMVEQKVEVSLVSPTQQVKDCMNDSIYSNHPAAVEVQVVQVL